MNKYQILFLSSAPLDKRRIDPGSEQRIIKAAFEQKGFNVNTENSVTKSSLEKALRNSKTPLIHFSGHGEQEGLVIHNESDIRSSEIYPKENLQALLSQNDHVAGLFLSACNSEGLAIDIAKHLKFCIGIKERYYETLAFEFAHQFYTELCMGKSVSEAFILASEISAVKNQEPKNRPQLYPSGTQCNFRLPQPRDENHTPTFWDAQNELWKIWEKSDH